MNAGFCIPSETWLLMVYSNIQKKLGQGVLRMGTCCTIQDISVQTMGKGNLDGFIFIWFWLQTKSVKCYTKHLAHFEIWLIVGPTAVGLESSSCGPTRTRSHKRHAASGESCSPSIPHPQIEGKPVIDPHLTKMLTNGVHPVYAN